MATMNLTFNFWGASLFALAVGGLALLYYLYRHYFHTPHIITYCWFVIFVIVWVFLNATLILFRPSVPVSTLLNKITYIAGALIATTLWLFFMTRILMRKV